jgi:hypothetical protein
LPFRRWRSFSISESKYMGIPNLSLSGGAGGSAGQSGASAGTQTINAGSGVSSTVLIVAGVVVALLAIGGILFFATRKK